MNIELSVVIPAYNEAQRLPSTLSQVKEYLDAEESNYQIIVVDDGSTDATVSIARQAQVSFPQLQVLENGRNRGKGFSVRSGFLHAGGALVLLTDADLSAPIGEFEKLRSALDGNHGAIGSRALRDSQIFRHQPIFRELSGKIFNVIMRILTGLSFHDTQCGFKLFRREPFLPVFQAQRSDGFAFDVEILYLARKFGLKVVEVPVRWGNVAGSRVGLAAGMKSFIEIVKIVWMHR
ncbi:MAG TPA: dolichyl-phosphate beta-glucosyltransferase [Acidobacteriota bacterium]|nr:dolichyl-phosphate beta-glucosyltransferase [Acidobacteriota bacterium]